MNHMTGAEMKAARASCDATQREWGVMLGLPGETPDRTVRAWENGETEISKTVALAVAQVILLHKKRLKKARQRKRAAGGAAKQWR